MCASPLWESLPGNCEHSAAPSKPASDGTECSFSVIAQRCFILDIVFGAKQCLVLSNLVATAEGLAVNWIVRHINMEIHQSAVRFLQF